MNDINQQLVNDNYMELCLKYLLDIAGKKQNHLTASLGVSYLRNSYLGRPGFMKTMDFSLLCKASEFCNLKYGIVTKLSTTNYSRRYTYRSAD